MELLPYQDEMDLLPTSSDLNDTSVAEDEEEEVTPTVPPTSPVPFIPTVSTQSAPSQVPLDRRRCVTGRVAKKAPLKKQNRSAKRKDEKEGSSVPNRVLPPFSPHV